jgi:ArsR family transcriptional regulator
MKQQLNGDQFLKVLEALSNPYRLKILAVLYKERQYVSKLARQLGISRPLLYLHLQKLEDAELIKDHEISEDGKAMKYFELIPFSLPIDGSLIASVAESVTIKKKKE